MNRMSLFIAVAILVTAQPLLAAPMGYFDLDTGVALESGDTWTANGERYRLYGVQACLRGTTFTNNAGKTQDCGDASLSVLAAFIKDTHPSCAPIARAAGVVYVVCFAAVAGERLDLATMLISEGYAFAALDAKGMPVNPAYAVGEQEARARKAGLWQFPDVRHPSILLGRAASDHQEKAR
ncbi:thermonuclease family protein [Rhizobium sp. CNPSo 3464]|uniref:thermonuclease family protein n=1 Tax=Rhizobium sp. CNPSo 3464 TaxID=3021406 RepID=UPI00254FC8EE|nr:thermonuclease family protein [Rhizobium sp. CNPSo 3464]MDK4741333.1 thermonuclease family protein [Rhizobium sp. CNPSo 3464]